MVALWPLPVLPLFQCYRLQLTIIPRIFPNEGFDMVGNSKYLLSVRMPALPILGWYHWKPVSSLVKGWIPSHHHWADHVCWQFARLASGKAHEHFLHGYWEPENFIVVVVTMVRYNIYQIFNLSGNFPMSMKPHHMIICITCVVLFSAVQDDCCCF